MRAIPATGINDSLQTILGEQLIGRREAWIKLASRCDISNPWRSYPSSEEELSALVDGFIVILREALEGETRVQTRFLEQVLPAIVQQGGIVGGILYSVVAWMSCVVSELVASLPEEQQGPTALWLSSFFGSFISEIIRIGVPLEALARGPEPDFDTGASWARARRSHAGELSPILFEILWSRRDRLIELGRQSAALNPVGTRIFAESEIVQMVDDFIPVAIKALEGQDGPLRRFFVESQVPQLLEGGVEVHRAMRFSVTASVLVIVELSQALPVEYRERGTWWLADLYGRLLADIAMFAIESSEQ